MSSQLRLKFDAYQDFQLSAVDAVVDLFSGYPRQDRQSQLGDEIARNAPYSEAFDWVWLSDNLNTVQEHNGLSQPGLRMESELETSGAVLHHREGSPRGGWILLDFGDLVVHLFAPDEREYYHLEGAWPGAVEVVRLQ